MQLGTRVLLGAALSAALIDHAWAAPPASCAKKFVGTWAYAIGTTRVTADGNAYPKCASCVGHQTWTCEGNTFILLSPTPARGTLSADGRTMSGSWGVSTRVGGAAVAAAPSGQPPKPKADANPAQKKVAAAPPQDANDCNRSPGSGISGLPGSTQQQRPRAAAKPCPPADKPGSQAAAAAPAAKPVPPQVPGSNPSGADVEKFMVELVKGLPSLSDNRPVNPPAPAPARRRAPSADATPEVEETTEAAVASRTPDQEASAITDADEKDYAEACQLTAVKGAMASLKHDISAAQARVASRELPAENKDERVNREWRSWGSFHKVKLLLTKRVLKKCLSDVLDKAIVEQLELAGWFDQ